MEILLEKEILSKGQRAYRESRLKNSFERKSLSSLEILGKSYNYVLSLLFLLGSASNVRK